MKLNTKAIIICRKPRASDKHDFKTALIKLFSENDPHKLGVLPKQEMEFHNIEKIVIRGLDVNMVLEGNDLVINDVGEVNVEHNENSSEVVVEKV